MDGPSAQGFLSLTALRAEGCGIALGHTFGVKVLKMDRPDGRKVLKFDGLSGRGLWYRPAGDEYYNAAFGGHVHIEYHNHSYHRPPLRHFVALFP